MQEYTAVVKRQGRWWYGWIEGIPGINCQERTKAHLRETLRATLREAIAMNRKDVRRSAAGSYTEELITI